MQITALLTGRGNNTLADKNIAPLLGKPVLYYPAMAARRSQLISRFFVSSDCPRILTASHKCGYELIRRPSALATPTSQHYETIIHALEIMGDRDHYPDILVVLLANSITVCTDWIDDCIRMVQEDPTASAAVPVVLDLDHHPFRAKQICSDGSLRPFLDFGSKPISSNRQEMNESYFLCHNFWVLRTEGGRINMQGDPPWIFMGPHVLPYIVKDSIDIHDENDLELAERWLRIHGG